MQYLKKIILFMVLLVMNVTLTGCGNKNEDKIEKVEISNYSNTIIIESNEKRCTMLIIINYMRMEQLMM